MAGSSIQAVCIPNLCLALPPCPKVPPLFGKEDTRERLRKLPGGPTQPLTVRAGRAAAAAARRQTPLALASPVPCPGATSKPHARATRPTQSHVRDPVRVTPLPPTPQVSLRQEIDRTNVVLGVVKSTLTNLRLAIAGAHGAGDTIKPTGPKPRVTEEGRALPVSLARRRRPAPPPRPHAPAPANPPRPPVPSPPKAPSRSAAT
jgi:hypothetical protein